jgi:hypothetical protein
MRSHCGPDAVGLADVHESSREKLRAALRALEKNPRDIAGARHVYERADPEARRAILDSLTRRTSDASGYARLPRTAPPRVQLPMRTEV